MDVTFFPTPDDFRGWLAEHHASARELWVGFYKKATGRASITWPESVDEALCFGWIDGIRKSIDDEAYRIRFTPRRPGSHWSRVNLERVVVLIEEGRMAPAGLSAWEARDPEKSGRYSHERGTEEGLTEPQLRRLRSNRKAWAFWQAQPPGYRRLVAGWIASAKKEETRGRRLDTLIEDCANGLRIKHLRRG
jgi:uncharacterized protein YdeI (YjbR/CyaY-like superfamily)